MKNDFPRILTLLRKERGISQKEAAAKLGITQALLSHYEKGVRECGLDFVIAVADEYGVSTDYLLGRTSDRHGVIVTAEELPEQTDAAEDKRFNGSIVATLNKKLLVNSITILYDQLQSSKLKSLTTEVSAYLCLAVYKVFRMVYGLNPKNPEAMFAIRHNLYNGLTNAAMNVTEAYLNTICNGESLGDCQAVKPEEAPLISPEKLSEKYPVNASSLLNVISTAETRMGAKPKK